MAESGADIIIKSGSVDLQYDESIYQKDPNDPKKHRNNNKKITKVVISGDVNYDSGDHPNGLSCTITTTCK